MWFLLGVIIVVSTMVSSTITGLIALNLMATDWYCKKAMKAAQKMTETMYPEAKEAFKIES